MPESEYVFRTARVMDFEALERLINEFLPGFVQSGYWRWKYLLNPYFDQSFVVLTEKNGEIIGCVHWIPGRLKIASNIEVNANLGTDAVTIPEYRKRGIIKSMILFMENKGILASKGATVNYAYMINERFARGIQYTPLKSSTRPYLLLLSWKKTIKRINEANKNLRSSVEAQRMFAHLNLVLLFRLKGAPPLTISIRKEEISVSETESEHASVIVEGNLGTFNALMTGKRMRWKLLKAFATRRLRVRGSLLDLFKLWRSFGTVLKILRPTS